jgi:hypothetical protein
MRALLGFCLLVLAGFSVSVNAALLFDNGTDTTYAGGLCSACGFPNNDWQVWDDFTLSGNSVLRSLAFEGATIDPGDITISIWSAPNSGLIYSETYAFSDLSLARNTFTGNYDNYSFIAVLSDWNLGAGTYWISMYSEYLAIPNQNYINGSQQLDKTSDTWISRGSDTPFRLYSNVIPIPAAVWLFGSALAGLGWMRRKQTV